MTKPLVLIAGVLGIAFLIISIIYFIDPAKSLPSFFPGHDMTTKVHFKHGIGAFVLALGCFAFAWLQSGKKSPSKEQ